MQTGENDQALRKIIDMTRWMSVGILMLHFYYHCYAFFRMYEVRSMITDRLLTNLSNTGLFTSPGNTKVFALILLAVSLIGTKGKKHKNIHWKTPCWLILIGTIFYFGSSFLLDVRWPVKTLTVIYITVCTLSYIMILTGGTLVSRILDASFQNKVFNTENESFPQEERLLQNPYSINLPALHNLKGKNRNSWINIINPFRGLLVMGSPGSGKSYFIIQHIIKQHIEKGFTMLIYDFKFDDLTVIAYNQFLKHKHTYPKEPKFCIINFDDLDRSHRCNPLDANSMMDISDATESARSILMGLNRDWVKKQGEFFVESAINFLTAIIWFLKKYSGGKYCTLPHAIEMMQARYDKMFPVLRTETELSAYIDDFVKAWEDDSSDQLSGQAASAKVGIARLSSPRLYWILSGNDFTLDINNPEDPKILCIGNNPQKAATYGAVISLYTSAITRLINKKGKLPCHQLFDEFPTLYFNGIDSVIATARSNKVATTLAVQDASQLKLHYGKEQAEVIINLPGNIISGQASGETAKQLSERFGKILQDRESIAVNRNDTNITYSKQLDFAIPASRIASLSSGEFVGIVADEPLQKIQLKMFCSEILNDHAALKTEQENYEPIPVIAPVTQAMISANFDQVKADIDSIIKSEIERIMDTPELNYLIIKK